MNQFSSIQIMFDKISVFYDGMNRIISFFTDNAIRKMGYKSLRSSSGRILDAGGGTGILRKIISSEDSSRLINLDSSRGMLARDKKGHHQRICGDLCYIPFHENSFSAFFCAFVVRNVYDKKMFINELYRVLVPRGKGVFIVLGLPENRFIRRIYSIFLKRILPKISEVFVADGDSYAYLAESIIEFDNGLKFFELLSGKGFHKILIKRKLWGIYSIVEVTK